MAQATQGVGENHAVGGVEPDLKRRRGRGRQTQASGIDQGMCTAGADKDGATARTCDSDAQQSAAGGIWRFLPILIEERGCVRAFNQYNPVIFLAFRLVDCLEHAALRIAIG